MYAHSHKFKAFCKSFKYFAPKVQTQLCFKGCGADWVVPLVADPLLPFQKSAHFSPSIFTSPYIFNLQFLIYNALVRPLFYQSFSFLNSQLQKDQILRAFLQKINPPPLTNQPTKKNISSFCKCASIYPFWHGSVLKILEEDHELMEQVIYNVKYKTANRS